MSWIVRQPTSNPRNTNPTTQEQFWQPRTRPHSNKNDNIIIVLLYCKTETWCQICNEITQTLITSTSFSNLSIRSSYSCFSFFFFSRAFLARYCLYLVCIFSAASSFFVQTFSFGFAGSAGFPFPAAAAGPFFAP